jgi:hypothetical protein
MLNDLVKWRSIQKLSAYQEDTEYKYLNSVFNKWIKHNIFKDTYTETVHNNYYKYWNIKKFILIRTLFLL